MSKLITNEQCNEFLEVVTEIGILMMQYGAEVSRAEDTLSRICKAYEIQKSEVYASTTMVLITIKTKEGLTAVQSARVWSTSTNLGALENLNSLSRTICSTTPEISEIHKMTQKSISSVKMSKYNCIGGVIGVAAFTIFFGGSLLDGLSSAIIGIIVYFMDKYFKVQDYSKLIFTMIMSFVAGILAILLVKIGLGQNLDKIIIGIVMIFIPTLALVNGTKDMFYRNIISGIFRVIESILVAISIALGFGLSIITLGGIL